MPTRPGSDLVPVRTETKQRLAELKGDRTYDAVIRALLDNAAPSPLAPAARERAPEDQVALARLAAKRWRMRVEEGRIEELGPRLFVYHTQKEPRRKLRVTWTDRRGIAP